MDTIDYEDHVDHDTNANITGYISILCKNFSKVMRRIGKRSENIISTNIKDNQHHNLKGYNFQRRGKYCERQSLNHLNKAKGIQCRECNGFGHIQMECPNYLRKPRKNYNDTFSNDD